MKSSEVSCNGKGGIFSEALICMDELWSGLEGSLLISLTKLWRWIMAGEVVVTNMINQLISIIWAQTVVRGKLETVGG